MEKKVIHNTQATHSSTFPCLYAYPRDEIGNIDLEKRFVFLKYSHSYNQHNSTIELPVEVNKTDTFLDGTVKQGKLRGEAIKIINAVALGKMNPTYATKLFLRIFEELLIRMLCTMDRGTLRWEVLKIYLEQVQEVIREIHDSSVIFDQIMGVKLPDSDPILREIVYGKRYALIQEAEFIESQIARRIFQAQKTMLEREVKSLKKVDYRLSPSLSL